MQRVSPVNPQPEWCAQLLTQPRIEVFPLPGIADRTIAATDGAKVAVTCSPRKGIEATMQLTERLMASGIEVSPHLSARQMRDRAHARRIAEWLDNLGVRDVFVIGGDARQPAGPFPSAASLLSYFAESGVTFDQVGVAAYPEGHPTVDDATLWHALADKQAWATYVVTQLCFDSGPILRWIKEARARGIRLPVHVGLAGAVDRMKLMRTALRIGVGDSTRFVTKRSNVVANLLGRRSYTPDALIAELCSQSTDSDIAGWHLYTFNEIEATESWGRRVLQGR
ncbi:methylenetetrahydrofolate reductase [soil metagenome]